MVSSTEEEAEQVWMMYPNPALDWVKLVFPEGMSDCQVELSDESGRVLRSIDPGSTGGISAGKTSSCLLDLHGLPSGIYFVTVLDERGKERFTAKLLKQ